MRQEFKLTLVDGFAGGGLYQQKGVSELQLGSPIQLLKTSEAAIVNIPINRRNRSITNDIELELNYYFVEKKKTNYDYLLDTLKNHGYQARIGKDIFLINQPFETVADEIIKKIIACFAFVFFIEDVGN